MGRIPFIRASQAEPFLGPLRATGTRTVPLLESVGIAPDVVEEDPDTLVAEHAIWDLVDRCAHAAGSDAFGWETGVSSPIGELGVFGRRVREAPTLGAALDLFLNAAQEHSSHAQFSIGRRNGATWFCRHGIPSISVGAWQVELYVLGLMVHVARSALGAAWVPAALTLMQRPRRSLRLPAALSDSKATYGAKVTAIQLPREALGEPVPTRPALAVNEDPIPLDMKESVRIVLQHALPTGRAALKHTARLAGVNPRTLQRCLDREGVTFEQVLDDMRQEEALDGLTSSDITVASLADRLGYANASNFTRAFRRWTGVSPSAFRYRQCRSDEPRIS